MADTQPHPEPDAEVFTRRLRQLHAARYGQRPPSLEKLAADISANGTSVTFSYLSMLLSGTRTNPSWSVVSALAHHYQVPADYFDPRTSDQTAEHVLVLLQLQLELDSEEIRGIGLTRQELEALPLPSLRKILDVVRRVRELERDRHPQPTPSARR